MAAWPTTLRARLTLWYTLMLALPLVGFAVVTYFAFAQALEGRTDRFLDEALTAVSREAVAERRQLLSASDALRSAVTEVRFRELRIVVRDSTGALVVESREGSMPPPPPERDWLLAALRRHAPLDSVWFSVREREEGHRVLARPLAIGALRYSVAGAYPLGEVEAVLDRMRQLFLLAIPLLLAVAALAGSVLAKRGLAPVAGMAERAAEISASTLHERLPVGGGQELVQLSQVVNALLDRLQDAFMQQQRFMADASHELRTPTAIVRAEAEVTLSRPHRSEAEYRESVQVMHDAAQRLTRIVDDLFLIARADAGNLVARREPLYLEEVVHEAARAVRHVAEQRGVRVEVDALVPAPVLGDAALLDRLLLNLLDNAIKHAPQGTAVRVGMRAADGRCAVTVVDEGEGIPVELQERIFERFFRVDRARARATASVTSGAGLGLAIARRIAGLHEGTLALAASRPGRTEFVLDLPLEATAE